MEIFSHYCCPLPHGPFFECVDALQKMGGIRFQARPGCKRNSFKTRPLVRSSVGANFVLVLISCSLTPTTRRRTSPPAPPRQKLYLTPNAAHDASDKDTDHDFLELHDKDDDNDYALDMHERVIHATLFCDNYRNSVLDYDYGIL